MRFLLALLYVAPLAPLLGQGVVPPFQLGQVHPLPGLNAGSVPASEVHLVHMVHLPGDPPSVFYCAAAVAGLSPAYGGVGGFNDLLCGSYDVLTDTFIPNNEAAALNTIANDVNMSLHHTGLFAVFERGFASSLMAEAWLVSRPAIGQPWQIVGRIAPLPPQGPYFPALADYQGQPHLLYSPMMGTQAYNILMAQIDLTAAVLTAPPTVIVNPIIGVFGPFGPIPVTDPNGELIGVSHGALDYTSIDHYMSLDLNPWTPPVLMNDVTTLNQASGFVGGRFFDFDATVPYHIFAIDTCWFTGGRAAVGGTMYVRMFSPPTSGPQLYLSMFAVNSAFSLVGLPIPPVQGLLGINAAGGWASALILHNNANGEAQVSFVIPNVPGLRGARLSAQSATWETVSGAVYLGNTAQLLVDW